MPAALTGRDGCGPGQARVGARQKERGRSGDRGGGRLCRRCIFGCLDGWAVCGVLRMPAIQTTDVRLSGGTYSK